MALLCSFHLFQLILYAVTHSVEIMILRPCLDKKITESYICFTYSSTNEKKLYSVSENLTKKSGTAKMWVSLLSNHQSIHHFCFTIISSFQHMTSLYPRQQSSLNSILFHLQSLARRSFSVVSWQRVWGMLWLQDLSQELVQRLFTLRWFAQPACGRLGMWYANTTFCSPYP